MNEKELINDWEEKKKQILRLNRKRVYGLIFQMIASGVVLMFAFNGMIDSTVTVIMILMIMVVALMINQMIHRKIQGILLKQREKIDLYEVERERV